MDWYKVLTWALLPLWMLLGRMCEAGRCEQITVNFCRGLWYNFTSMPNDLGHERQHDVHFDLLFFRDMVEERCSPHSRRFLCAMFLPRCSWTGPSGMRVEHPCRQDCELVKIGCEHYLNKSGSNWPRFLSCDRLPDHSCLKISAPAAPSIDIIIPSDPMGNAATSQYLLTQTNYRLFMALQAMFCLYSAMVL